MVDIHCHILPRIDDGSDSIETSLEMAEMAIADGVTHVIATPHADGEYEFNPELIALRREEIQSRLGDRLSILTGCDFHLNFENLRTLRTDRRRYTLNQGDYLLVEFGNFAIPAAMDQALYELKLVGLHPIITHPERNPLIRSQWDRLWGWMSQGCYVQVTAQSITGGFGRTAQQAADLLLETNAVHFIASDAHNVTTRPLRLRPVYEALAKSDGDERARALLEDNPRAALENRTLPYVPEPGDWKKAQMEIEPERDRKRFWFF